jgi:hypothetical protein
MHEARRLHHIKITERPVPGRKSLPNLVEIASSQWAAWIKRAPSTASRIGSNSVKMVSTTKNINLRKKGLGKEMQCGSEMGHLNSRGVLTKNPR